MDASTVITLLISSMITGAGIGFGFWFVSKRFLQDLTKNIPGYIHEVMSESRKTKAVEDALAARRNYT